MSYHYPKDCSILPWIKDLFLIHEIWGIPTSQINIGIGLFSFNGSTQITWDDVSNECPDIQPSDCECKGVYFVSKHQHEKIGKWVRDHGYRGVFPWAASYDINHITIISQ